MKDKNGHDYKELLAFQRQHLANWETRLKTPLHMAVEEYVFRHNREANDDKSAHQVFRGQDIVQIIVMWPDVTPCYPPVQVAEDLI